MATKNNNNNPNFLNADTALELINSLGSHNPRAEFVLKIKPAIDKKIAEKQTLKAIYNTLQNNSVIDNGFSFSLFKKHYYLAKKEQKNNQVEKIDSNTFDKIFKAVALQHTKPDVLNYWLTQEVHGEATRKVIGEFLEKIPDEKKKGDMFENLKAKAL